MHNSPDERFSALVESFRGRPGVEPPSLPGRGRPKFGDAGLKVKGHNFAMLVRGTLVLKLPKSRVDALVDAGEGTRFDPRKNGRVMKEWLVLSPSSRLEWNTLAEEALAFVRESG